MNEIKEILVGLLVVVYGIMFYIVGRTNLLEKFIERILNNLLEELKDTANVAVGEMYGFTVIDNTTGAYPDCEKIALTEEWAKHLIYCDIDTFAINEDGVLILMDDCGNCAYCPADRFTVVYEKGR